MLADGLKFLSHFKQSIQNNTTGEGLFRFSVQCVFATKPAVFIEFQFIGRRPLIFGRRVISSFALIACKGNNYSHR
jgi:hypothetical protein